MVLNPEKVEKEEGKIEEVIGHKDDPDADLKMIAIENNADDSKYIADIKINGKSVNQATVGNKVAVVINNCLIEELENVRYILNADNLHNKNSETWSNQWVNRYTTMKEEERKREEAKLKIKNIFIFHTSLMYILDYIWFASPV